MAEQLAADPVRGITAGEYLGALAGELKRGELIAIGAQLEEILKSRAFVDPVGTMLRALEVFGDKEKALRWLRTPNPALGYVRPLRPHPARRYQLIVAFRLCDSRVPPYDGEGPRLYGGRWSHKGIPVV